MLRLFFLFASLLQTPDDFPAAFNTDPPDSHPPAPAEMLPLIQLPEGFTVCRGTGCAAADQYGI
jgi:hypothetical protein